MHPSVHFYHHGFSIHIILNSLVPLVFIVRSNSVVTCMYIPFILHGYVLHLSLCYASPYSIRCLYHYLLLGYLEFYDLIFHMPIIIIFLFSNSQSLPVPVSLYNFQSDSESYLLCIQVILFRVVFSLIEEPSSFICLRERQRYTKWSHRRSFRNIEYCFRINFKISQYNTYNLLFYHYYLSLLFYRLSCVIKLGYILSRFSMLSGKYSITMSTSNAV